MLYRVLILLLAVAIWLGFRLSGHETHGTDGVIFFGLVAAEGMLIWLQSRTPKAPNSLNSFVLPLGFMVNFNLSGWWLLAGLVALVWAWALTRKQKGDYDFTPGFALVGALIFTGAVVIGCGAGYFLH